MLSESQLNPLVIYGNTTELSEPIITLKKIALNHAKRKPKAKKNAFQCQRSLERFIYP